MATATHVEPAEVIAAAHDLVVAGVPAAEAAAKLAAAFPAHGDLEAAHWAWTDRMRRLPSDDFRAARVLRVLLAALAR
jgi:hypothetical protein